MNLWRLYVRNRIYDDSEIILSIMKTNESKYELEEEVKRYWIKTAAKIY
jgi:hypothetical protein